MNITNLKRANRASEELQRFNENIEMLEDLLVKVINGDSSVLIKQHHDEVGLGTEYQYVNGGYNVDLGEELLRNTISIFLKHREKLIKEIENL